MLSVGTPFKGAYQFKFFFIHPIAGAIDDGIDFSVAGYAGGISTGQVFVIQVIIHYKGYFATIGRKMGVPLFVPFKKAGQVFGGLIVHKKLGLGTPAINLLGLGRDEYFLFVGTEAVAIEGVFPAGRLGFDAVRIQYLPRNRTGAQVTLFDGRFIEAGIMHPVFLKIKPRDAFCRKSALLPDVFQRNRFLGQQCGTHQNEKKQEPLFHIRARIGLNRKYSSSFVSNGRNCTTAPAFSMNCLFFRHSVLPFYFS